MLSTLKFKFLKKTKNAWISNNIHEFTKQNIDLLFKNKIPYVIIKNFISNEKCDLLIDCAKKQGLDYYEDTFPRVGKIGVTQYEHSFSPKFPYFFKSCQENLKRQNLVKASKFDPVENIFSLFNEENMNLKVMTEKEYCDYYIGLYRIFEPGTYAPIHFDYAPVDGKDWEIGKITQQLSYNIYLQIPKIGGELFVYNMQWKKDKHDKFKLPKRIASYGFSEEMVKDAEFVKFIPKKGDLVLFNSQNFHEVKKGNDYRFSISSFIGREKNDSKEIWMWN